MSDTFNLESGVPQGHNSLILYVAGLFKNIEKCLPSAHGFADDTQIHRSFRPNTPLSEDNGLMSIENCVAEIRVWMLSSPNLINGSKIEFIIIGFR